VKKMRVLSLAIHQNYDEALAILEPLRAVYPDDRFICGYHAYCMENRPERKQRAKKPRARYNEV
jgi:hypothetical protein